MEDKNMAKDPSEIEKLVRSRISSTFDSEFRKSDFVNILSDTVTSYSDLARIMGFGKSYESFSVLWAKWNNEFVEPVRDLLWRTPSRKVCQIEKYSLFHYQKHLASEKGATAADTTATAMDGVGGSDTITERNKMDVKTPLLIVYAFINRHYILDLVPEASVMRNLLKQGFDIYATDWGTPSFYDRDLTIGHFLNYIDRSIDFIRNASNSDKVSLFGYCWGGDLVLMYASMHPEKVKNIITVATPGDFSADDTLLSLWTKRMNVDALLRAYGNAPAPLLNSAFLLRNPIEVFNKYPHFFEQPHGFESTLEFLATETWLYDSPPVIGEIFREFVKSCYQQNLFIKNEMNVDGNVVNLKNIEAPFLNVVAQQDDLVAPASSRALNEAAGSKDKSIMEFSSGHVGLIIGQLAHREVWPKVGQWLKERS